LASASWERLLSSGVVEEQAEYQKIVNQKYQAIIQRSFKSKLELYLFNECIITGNLNSVSLDGIINFKINTDLVDHLERAYQLKDGKVSENDKLDVVSIDTLIIEWNNNKEELKKEMLQAYATSFKRNYPIEAFQEIYPINKNLRKCTYCGINENEIENLKNNGQILTKRARGSTMEPDRLNSNKEYTFDNIVLACYWCNNAKTDEFTFKESIDFLGPSIKTIWANRLAKIPDG